MSAWLNTVLYGWYPYVAITVFLLGSVIRFDTAQYTWRSGSSQLLRRRQLIVGSNLFHCGILVILGGHVVGLLTPVAVFEALGISHTFKQALAMGVGGVAGIACFAGAVMLAQRRLFGARIRATSSFGDVAIILMLLAQVTLGLLTIPLSAQHMDGSEMLKFMAWAQGIATLHPAAAAAIADVNPVFKIHILLGLTIFLVFPFTRLVHVWSAPVWYLGRPGWQVVRTRRTLPQPRPSRGGG
jgi:nitrate reductase gamma subunit